MADLSALRARFRQDSGRLEDIRRELQGQTFEGRSEDERVTVTVSADGNVQDVHFDPRVFRTPVDSDGIASSVIYAYQRAVELATAPEERALQHRPRGRQRRGSSVCQFRRRSR